jgi:ribosomal 50S subunit-recycling heat shock protein
MRLDRYLKVTSLIKRRTVAKDAADAGRISVNGRPAKPSHEVRVGDRLEIRLAGRVIEVEVLAVREGMRPGEARESYRVLAERRLARDEEGEGQEH